MLIRKISEKDYDGIKKLVLQVHKLHLENCPDVYNDVDSFNKAYFDFLLKDEKTIALVSEKDTGIIGICIATLRNPSENSILKVQNVAFVEDLCVDEHYRKMGIGRALLEEMECQSKARGADVMELTVWSFNENAVNFYKTLGMSPRSITMEKHL
jgi:ribosomal protein S18 acetylase RimI-like enzyme